MIVCLCIYVCVCACVWLLLFVRVSACDLELTSDMRTMIGFDSCRGLDTNQAHSIGLPFSTRFFGMVIVTGTFKWVTQPRSVGEKCTNMIQTTKQMIIIPRTVSNKNATIRYQVGTNSVANGQIVVHQSVTHFDCRLKILLVCGLCIWSEPPRLWLSDGSMIHNGLGKRKNENIPCWSKRDTTFHYQTPQWCKTTTWIPIHCHWLWFSCWFLFDCTGCCQYVPSFLFPFTVLQVLFLLSCAFTHETVHILSF